VVGYLEGQAPLPLQIFQQLTHLFSPATPGVRGNIRLIVQRIGAARQIPICVVQEGRRVVPRISKCYQLTEPVVSQ